ncbi:MAG: SGNH/GDSL hydrolase family protein [Candidatus Krumholzibacteria bacterium]|nr:SGNH/GDSL hydrolase family protein [Candidatus Krumholzibacteria bacterium]
MRKKLLLVLGGVFFAFLIGEVAARVILPLLPDPPDTPFIGDDACMYRLRPSAPGRYPEDHDDHVNEYGFRDRNYPLTKPTGSYRVLGLGDSFVYGAVSTRDNFLRVAERTLDDGTDILLMGVPGWSTENELGVLEDFGLGLEPDLVIVNFFVGNDVTGIPVRGRVIRGNIYPTTSPLPVRNLLRKSQLFVMFESLVLRGMMKQLKDDETQAHTGETESDQVSELYLKIVPHNLPVFSREPDKRTAALWVEAESYLNRIDEVCRAVRVPWMLVVIPDEMQVDPVVRSQVLEGLGLSWENYDFDAPQRRLNDWARKHDIPVLDLLPVMRAEHDPAARLYVPNDTHWNKRGNFVAGQAVAEAISNMKHLRTRSRLLPGRQTAGD